MRVRLADERNTAVVQIAGVKVDANDCRVLVHQRFHSAGVTVSYPQRHQPIASAEFLSSAAVAFHPT